MTAISHAVNLATKAEVFAFSNSATHVCDGITDDALVELRTARDATLRVPDLIIPSLQINIRAGNLPEADETSRRHLKVPINEL